MNWINPTTERVLARGAALFAGGLLFAVAACAQSPATAELSQCDSLNSETLEPGTELLSVSLVAAADGMPARCRVAGAITTSPKSTINFQVDMPVQDEWNGNLLYLGGGGFDGVVFSAHPELVGQYDLNWFGPDAARSRSFVFVSSDSGHRGRGPVPMFDFSWAADNPDAITNFAYRANHLVLWTAVSLSQAYYGREPEHRYMHGMSGGGRQALMAAQTYPEDYDGIVAFSAAIAYSKTGSRGAVLRQIYSSPENWLDVEDRQLVADAELAGCDMLDGLKDGIIANYTACTFDPETLLCSPDADAGTSGCLTGGQVDALKLVYTDIRNGGVRGDGDFGYYPGGDVGEWQYLLGSAFAARDATNYILEDNRARIVSDNPNASIMTHDPDAYGDRYRDLFGEIDATDADLSAFRANGGKLMIFAGTSDLCVPFERLANYVASVEDRFGSDETRDFLRFYPLPSQGHNWSGNGLNHIASLSAVQAWVEQGKAPDDLVGSHVDDEGATVLTRPVCEAGSFAKYRGEGDPDSSESFFCATE